MSAEPMAPHSVEAEEAVLGSVLLNPDSWYDIASFLHAYDFFIVRNGYVWDAMAAIHDRGDAVDNLTVASELEHAGQLDTVGGSAYITYLINHTPTHIHVETYARLVERAALRRRLLRAASDIAQTALEENAEIEQVLDHAEASIFAVTAAKQTADLVPLRLLISQHYDVTEDLYNHPDRIPGLPTGFKDLDRILDGLQPKTLNLVAARPGFGKTSLMLNIGLNAARVHRKRVAIFSMEMSRAALTTRLMAAATGINSKKLRSGRLNEHEWALYTEASGRLADLPVYIDDTRSITPTSLTAKCRRLKREHGLDLIIVDYLQLMIADGGKKLENRVNEVSFISRTLKNLSGELDIPVLAASQLSRAVEQRQDKRPLLSDLRESGSLEQDADVVMFIYREDKYDDASTRPNEADIIVAKQRDGATGVVTLMFREEVTQFVETKRESLNLERIGENGAHRDDRRYGDD